MGSASGRDGACFVERTLSWRALGLEEGRRDRIWGGGEAPEGGKDRFALLDVATIPTSFIQFRMNKLNCC